MEFAKLVVAVRWRYLAAGKDEETQLAIVFAQKANFECGY
jgi:hypothetical protein